MKHKIFQLELDVCSDKVKQTLKDTMALAKKMRTEFITPEHLFYVITHHAEFETFANHEGIDLKALRSELTSYLDTLDKIPEDEEYLCLLSIQMRELMQTISKDNEKANKENDDEGSIFIINPWDLLLFMTKLKDSLCAYLIEKYLQSVNEEWPDSIYHSYENADNNGTSGDVVQEAYVNGKKVDLSKENGKLAASFGKLMGALKALGGSSGSISISSSVIPVGIIPGGIDGLPLPPHHGGKSRRRGGKKGETEKEPWEEMVTCINETYKKRNPLIGREKELSRAIRILCRRDKNNPIFIGEPGVGKTALIYGLARLIEESKNTDTPEIGSLRIPSWLSEQRIYEIDMAAMVAGASYHGEYERRLKEVFEGARAKGNCILYIDEIHSICDSGNSSSSMSAADLMKPYLEDGSIRFIGSTTYKDYNKSIANNKAISRRFGQVDVKEPSIDETIEILSAVAPIYEKHHRVRYDKEAISYAIEQSNALINDRYLPDKAIDIIDEAGAYLQQNPLLNKQGKPKPARYQKVDKAIVKKILTDVCRIDAKALSSESNDSLRELDKRISEDIYGQDDAIRQVVRSVMMSKAGLTEPEKPIASLLFVGPTGVGKTEVCKVLAREMGMELIRFDMSEYTEKHTISKLIGSPAGYVGYDEGGLLTDAIRKTPNCVLLLDEIEKAHSDIYNILLQVMDYAKLTDNKGNKIDFKNVILIMTSNAGAQFAAQAGIGFSGGQTKGQAMLNTVKKTFKPEFLNRLTGTVVFNEMDKTMAGLILDKKLRQLSDRLAKKNVTMTLTAEAHDYILKNGFTPQYGAREMDRVIQQHLTPLLMEEILFGRLRNGGDVIIELRAERLEIRD